VPGSAMGRKRSGYAFQSRHQRRDGHPPPAPSPDPCQ
jgi:hypothetical protein